MQILRSPIVLFFLLAAAVVLIAGGTFAVGRWWLSPKDVPPAPIAAQRPAIESAEENPVERAPDHKKPQLPAATGVVVMQEGSGDVNLTPATAALAGAVRRVPKGATELLAEWSQSGDEAAWTFQVQKPGFFELAVTYAAADEAGETSFTALLDDEEIKTLALRPTGSLDAWSTRQQTIALTSAGRHRLALRLNGEVEAGSLCVKQVRLIPAGASRDGK